MISQSFNLLKFYNITKDKHEWVATKMVKLRARISSMETDVAHNLCRTLIVDIKVLIDIRLFIVALPKSLSYWQSFIRGLRKDYLT